MAAGPHGAVSACAATEEQVRMAMGRSAATCASTLLVCASGGTLQNGSLHLLGHSVLAVEGDSKRVVMWRDVHVEHCMRCGPVQLHGTIGGRQPCACCAAKTHPLRMQAMQAAICCSDRRKTTSTDLGVACPAFGMRASAADSLARAQSSREMSWACTTKQSWDCPCSAEDRDGGKGPRSFRDRAFSVHSEQQDQPCCFKGLFLTKANGSAAIRVTCLDKYSLSFHTYNSFVMDILDVTSAASQPCKYEGLQTCKAVYRTCSIRSICSSATHPSTRLARINCPRHCLQPNRLPRAWSVRQVLVHQLHIARDRAHEYSSPCTLRKGAGLWTPSQITSEPRPSLTLICLLSYVRGSSWRLTIARQSFKCRWGLSVAERLGLAATMENTGFDYVVKPLEEFTKGSIRLIKRCTKPDKKGENTVQSLQPRICSRECPSRTQTHMIWP